MQWTELVRPKTAYAHATVVLGAEHAGKPGLQVGELPAACDAPCREREVMASTYRSTFSLADEYGDFGRMDLPESSYAWRILPGFVLNGDVVVTATARGRLQAQRPDAGTWSVARAVLRLGREPTPTSLYQHGSEVLIAAWGLALEPVSVELTHTSGYQVWLFIYEMVVHHFQVRVKTNHREHRAKKLRINTDRMTAADCSARNRSLPVVSRLECEREGDGFPRPLRCAIRVYAAW